jgi:hypothetical protein
MTIRNISACDCSTVYLLASEARFLMEGWRKEGNWWKILSKNWGIPAEKEYMCVTCIEFCFSYSFAARLKMIAYHFIVSVFICKMG